MREITALIEGDSLHGFTVFIAEIGHLKHDGLYWNKGEEVVSGRYVSLRSAKRAARRAIKRIERGRRTRVESLRFP